MPRNDRQNLCNSVVHTNTGHPLGQPRPGALPPAQCRVPEGAPNLMWKKDCLNPAKMAPLSPRPKASGSEPPHFLP